MVQSLTTQNSLLSILGQLDQYLSGAKGKLHNDGDVRQIDGFAIDVSGSASSLVSTSQFTPGPGSKTIKAGDVSGLLSPATLSDSLKLQEVTKQQHEFTQSEIDAAMKKDAGLYSFTIPDTVQISHIPLGAEPQSVELPGFIPGNVFKQGGEIDYFKSVIARDGELAKTEKNLQKQYGPDVKLGYDPLAQEYIMLRPGQFGYDNIQSAQDVFRQIPGELQKMGLNPATFSDVLNRYKSFL